MYHAVRTEISKRNSNIDFTELLIPPTLAVPVLDLLKGYRTRINTNLTVLESDETVIGNFLQKLKTE